MLNRYSTILSFILATLLATGAVELFYNSLGKVLIEPTGIDQTEIEKQSATRNVSKNVDLPVRKRPSGQRSEDYSIISKRNLFGKVEDKTKEKTPEPEPVLTTTSLNLRLLGTIGGEDSDQRAFIQNKSSNNQDIYFRGDAIEQAIIKEVDRGKIILTVNGKDEILLMEETKSPPSTGKTRNYPMPEVYTPEVINEPDEEIEAEDDIEPEEAEDNAENDTMADPGEKASPPITPRRRMTLKPKIQQVAEP